MSEASRDAKREDSGDNGPFGHTAGEKLKNYLLDAQLTHKEFASLIPCSRSLITLICNNSANPSHKMALRFQDVTGGIIKTDYFYPPRTEIKME